MPLNAHKEGKAQGVPVSNALRQPSGACCPSQVLVGKSVYALVVVAHKRARIATGKLHQTRRPRLRYAHLVQGVPGITWSAAPVAQKARVWKVRMKAASSVDIHHLQASADPEARQSEFNNPVQDQVLDTVPLGIDAATPNGVLCLAIPGGMNVFSSSQYNGPCPRHFQLERC